jgi:hypothetical protein
MARMTGGPPIKNIAIWFTSTTAITTEEAEDLEHSIHNINPMLEFKAGNATIQNPDFPKDFLTILLQSPLGKQFLEEITKSGIKWAQHRFERSGRPVCITVSGPDGNILKSILVKNAVDEPVDETESARLSQERERARRSSPQSCSLEARIGSSVLMVWIGWLWALPEDWFLDLWFTGRQSPWSVYRALIDSNIQVLWSVYESKDQ